MGGGANQVILYRKWSVVNPFAYFLKSSLSLTRKPRGKRTLAAASC